MNKEAAKAPSLNRSYNPVPALLIGMKRVEHEAVKMSKFRMTLMAPSPSGPKSKSYQGRYSPSLLASLLLNVPMVVHTKRTVSVMKAGRVTRQAIMMFVDYELSSRCHRE